MVLANNKFSCCRGSGWKYRHQQLYCRLLSIAVNECDHFLRRVSELKCLHQPGMLSSAEGFEG